MPKKKPTKEKPLPKTKAAAIKELEKLRKDIERKDKALNNTAEQLTRALGELTEYKQELKKMRVQVEGSLSLLQPFGNQPLPIEEVTDLRRLGIYQTMSVLHTVSYVHAKEGMSIDETKEFTCEKIKEVFYG